MLAAVYAITRSRSHPRHKGPASMRPFSFQNAPNTSCAVPSVSQTIGRRLNAISPVYSARVETGRDEPVAVAAMPSGVPVPALQREARVRRGYEHSVHVAQREGNQEELVSSDGIKPGRVR